MKGTDEIFMLLALELAREAARLGEVPVGCVVTRDGSVVGRGCNRRESARNALAHAELIAIDEACRTLGGWRLSGADIYVTLEPCPMCAGAIINARPDNVYFGAADAKSGACGSVVNLFELGLNHKPRCVGGIMGEESSALLTEFFTKLRGGKKNS